MFDLSAVKDFKVLIVGDGIMDQYRYVRPVGKAVKEAALSVEEGKLEVFEGGVWAAARHTAGVCERVDCYAGPQVMWNTRLVDETYLRKLMVLHRMVTPPQINTPIPDVGAYDVVIVTDFGHGTMTPELIRHVSEKARYLAVNVQTNSTNYGFNLVTKYKRADFVVLDELEARLAARMKDEPLEDVILALGYRKIIVTQGKNGALGFDGAFERQAAVAEKVVDTLGAGDAFISIAAPFAAAGFSMKQLLRIGNAAGAAKVAIVGHRSSVTREQLEAHLNG